MNLFFRCCVPVGVGRGFADRNGYIVTRRHRGHLLVRCLSRYHARGGWHVRCQGCLARIRCGRRLQRRSRDDSVKYVMKHCRRTITQVPRSLPDPQIDLDLSGMLCTFFEDLPCNLLILVGPTVREGPNTCALLLGFEFC